MRRINPQRDVETSPEQAVPPLPLTHSLGKHLSVSCCLDREFHLEMGRDILSGLTGTKKTIPCKYLYDAYGSRLFDTICTLPEYYPTRTEMAILHRHATEIMAFFSREGGNLVEIGSGSDMKIRSLLEGIAGHRLGHIRYVPVDISETSLLRSARNLTSDFQDLTIFALIADFSRHLEYLPSTRKLITFFGGTFGNFTHEEGVALLKGFSRIMDRQDRMLIGIDMLKPVSIIEAAYNDRNGVTAQFNLNILQHVNRRLRADFRPGDFDHAAFFHSKKEQIEMHLKARSDIRAYIADLGLKVDLCRGETIRTEISRKFSRARAQACFDEAGLLPIRWFTDAKEWFSLVELAAQEKKKPD